MPSRASLALSALAAAALVAPAIAFRQIAVPDQVIAGQDTQVIINADFDKGESSFDAQFTNYSLYLGFTPPGWGTGPICLLLNQSDIHDLTPKINIPASVGPSTGVYMLVANEINLYKEDSWASESGFVYGRQFELVGGREDLPASKTRSWIARPDRVPCTAYDCVRACQFKFEQGYDQRDICTAKAQLDCLIECPGVTASPWDPQWGNCTTSGHLDTAEASPDAETPSADELELKP